MRRLILSVLLMVVMSLVLSPSVHAEWYWVGYDGCLSGKVNPFLPAYKSAVMTVWKFPTKGTVYENVALMSMKDNALWAEGGIRLVAGVATARLYYRHPQVNTGKYTLYTTRTVPLGVQVRTEVFIDNTGAVRIRWSWKIRGKSITVNKVLPGGLIKPVCSASYVDISASSPPALNVCVESIIPQEGALSSKGYSPFGGPWGYCVK